MENEWFKYSEKIPPLGVEVIAQSDAWIDPDFNPNGFRVGFQNFTEERNDPGFEFVSAYWWDYQETYMNDSESFPTKWKFIQ